MRLSPTTGKGLMGQGSGTISIDGVEPPSLTGYVGGGWGWLDDDTCGGQAFTGGLWHLKQLVVSTDTLTDLVATTSASDLAQQFRAGNLNWARFVAGGGIHSSAGLGLTLPLAALGDIDASGRMAVVQNYAADNGIVTYAANGSTMATISASVLAGTQRLRAKDDLVAYQDGQLKWHLRDIVSGSLASFAPRTDVVVASMVPVKISGTVWVVEVSATAISIRPATSSTGYILSTSPNIFFPDAVSLSAGTVRVGWSITSGESRTSLRLADFVTTTGGFTSGTTASGSLVLTPESPITPSATPVGPVEGGTRTSTKQPRYAGKRDAWTGEHGLEIYQAWWDTIAGDAVAPADLSQATGTVDPAHGGTGVTTGLTVLPGQNIIAGSTPLTALEDETASTLIGRGSLAGDGPPQEITLGTGLTMTGTVLSSSGGGSWIPLVDGSEPPVFITDGSGVLILVAGP